MCHCLFIELAFGYVVKGAQALPASLQVITMPKPKLLRQGLSFDWLAAWQLHAVQPQGATPRPHQYLIPVHPHLSNPSLLVVAD